MYLFTPVYEPCITNSKSIIQNLSCNQFDRCAPFKGTLTISKLFSNSFIKGISNFLSDAIILMLMPCFFIAISS